jgi:hypothetical protein
MVKMDSIKIKRVGSKVAVYVSGDSGDYLGQIDLAEVADQGYATFVPVVRPFIDRWLTDVTELLDIICEDGSPEDTVDQLIEDGEIQGNKCARQ